MVRFAPPPPRPPPKPPPPPTKPWPAVFSMSFECRQVSGYVVHILVSQQRGQRFVRLEWILDLDLRAIAFATERAQPSVVEHQRDKKVVEARQLALDLL